MVYVRKVKQKCEWNKIMQNKNKVGRNQMTMKQKEMKIKMNSETII